MNYTKISRNQVINHSVDKIKSISIDEDFSSVLNGWDFSIDEEFSSIVNGWDFSIDEENSFPCLANPNLVRFVFFSSIVLLSLFFFAKPALCQPVRDEGSRAGHTTSSNVATLHTSAQTRTVQGLEQAAPPRNTRTETQTLTTEPVDTITLTFPGRRQDGVPTVERNFERTPQTNLLLRRDRVETQQLPVIWPRRDPINNQITFFLPIRYRENENGPLMFLYPTQNQLNQENDLRMNIVNTAEVNQEDNLNPNIVDVDEVTELLTYLPNWLLFEQPALNNGTVINVENLTQYRLDQFVPGHRLQTHQHDINILGFNLTIADEQIQQYLTPDNQDPQIMQILRFFDPHYYTLLVNQQQRPLTPVTVGPAVPRFRIFHNIITWFVVPIRNNIQNLFGAVVNNRERTTYITVGVTLIARAFHDNQRIQRLEHNYRDLQNTLQRVQERVTVHDLNLRTINELEGSRGLNGLFPPRENR
jgi:hypothetical protein